MHDTNMLATGALRRHFVSIHRRPLFAGTVISRPTHGNANGCVRISTRSQRRKLIGTAMGVPACGTWSMVTADPSTQVGGAVPGCA